VVSINGIGDQSGLSFTGAGAGFNSGGSRRTAVEPASGSGRTLPLVRPSFNTAGAACSSGAITYGNGGRNTAQSGALECGLLVVQEFRGHERVGVQFRSEFQHFQPSN
jgi:hypothetical protein